MSMLAHLQKDVEEIVLEARKLNEEVERLEREKEAKESLAQAKSRQCELLCTKVSNLATELKELKTVAQGKQRLLEVKEQENFELANVLQDLQHKFEKDVHYLFASSPYCFLDCYVECKVCPFYKMLFISIVCQSLCIILRGNTVTS